MKQLFINCKNAILKCKRHLVNKIAPAKLSEADKKLLEQDEIDKAEKIELKKEKKQAAIEAKKEMAQKEDVWVQTNREQKENLRDHKYQPTDSFISLQHINKIYPNKTQAVFDFNLEIQKNEFIVFVGPSGCGKSTTLRMIAGLESITEGALFINGSLANYLEPKDRGLAMVFQSYALYPHMTVYENLAFGLQVRHVPKKEIDERIKKAAKILQIEQFLDRKPKNLSGGQCQRVALGRAIVRNTEIFLMDEPLSNLDAKLRVQMRSEIVNLHHELGATTIYVTHDQTEAMTMASRIVVMKDGYVQQIGTPRDIYDNPSNTFVATFIGNPAMNLITASIKDNNVRINDELNFALSAEQIKKIKEFYKDKPEHDEKVIFGIRPEDVSRKDKAGKNTFEITVSYVELLGNEYHVHTFINDQKFIFKLSSRENVAIGDKIILSFEQDRFHIFDSESTLSIF